MGRLIATIDRELREAHARRAVHTDPYSRRGNEITIDGLLDERWAEMRIPDQIRAKGN